MSLICKTLKRILIKFLAWFKIIDETSYLLKSSANASRLLDSIENYERSIPNKTSPIL